MHKPIVHSQCLYLASGLKQIVIHTSPHCPNEDFVNRNWDFHNKSAKYFGHQSFLKDAGRLTDRDFVTYPRIQGFEVLEYGDRCSVWNDVMSNGYHNFETQKRLRNEALGAQSGQEGESDCRCRKSRNDNSNKNYT